MLANTATEDNHTSLLRRTRQVIQLANVPHDIYGKSWVTERMDVEHVSNRSVRQSRTENGDVVLGNEKIRKMTRSTMPSG